MTEFTCYNYVAQTFPIWINTTDISVANIVDYDLEGFSTKVICITMTNGHNTYFITMDSWQKFIAEEEK